MRLNVGCNLETTVAQIAKNSTSG